MIIMPKLFGDGCVLRRGDGTKIWGAAEPGEAVHLAFQNEAYETVADAEGRWRVCFKPLAAGGPFVLTVNDHVIRDVFVGEVWLAAGQSNMELTFDRAGRLYPEALAAPPNPMIRSFRVPIEYDFHGERADLSGGAWVGAEPGTIAGFSAVGYFFAKKISEEQGVPVGLITNAAGGTPIAAWMRRASLDGFPEELAALAEVQDDDFVARTIRADDAAEAAFHAELDAADDGMNHQWHAPDFDDGDWDEADPTVTQIGSGAVWYRKTIQLPANLPRMPGKLDLGTIVDADDVWVNGAKVGHTDYRYPPRGYAVPPLQGGACAVAVRQVIKAGWGKWTEGKERRLAIGNFTVRLDGDWRRRRGCYRADCPGRTFFQFKPTGLYNAMVAPMRGLAVNGAIWYQGESDSTNAGRYAEKFKRMAGDWRRVLGEDFPFYTVGLARFDECDWTALRAQQRLAADEPGVYLFDAWDYGEANDLHPLAKRPVGEGLARLYGGGGK